MTYLEIFPSFFENTLTGLLYMLDSNLMDFEGFSNTVLGLCVSRISLSSLSIIGEPPIRFIRAPFFT